MKPSVRLTMVPILALAGSMLAFGSGQAPIRQAQSEAQAVQGATPAIQQGKGGGLSRNQTVVAEANRVQTPQERQAIRELLAKHHDSAFRK
jgi:hypothetical protein